MPEEEKKEKEGQEDSKASAGSNSSDKSIGSLKSGDYMVHILVQEARQLSPKENESTVNPLVEVEVFKKKKLTSVKENIGGSGGVYWGEHLFFEKSGVRAKDAENEKIKIKVLHKSTFKKQIIGTYEFDLTYVYFMEKHCVQHMWLALTDVGGQDFQKITGYLKVSMSVIATGDEQVELKDEEGLDKTDSSTLLMPPQIRTEQYQMIFRFAKAEHLPKLDSFMGTCDGFVKIQFLGKKVKTNWKKQENKQLWWNEELYIPAMSPVVASRIVLKVYDYDTASTDTLIGSIISNFRHINGKYNGKIRWENIYGAPPGKHGKNTDLMNRSPELASTWKGRVLLQYKCAKSEEAYLKREPFAADEQIEEPQNRPYTVKFEVRQGVCLPKNDYKFKIKLKIAQYQFVTNEALACRNDLNMWNKGFYEEIQLPYFTAEEIERAYVYLMDDQDPVCYRRFDIQDCQQKNPDFKWMSLQVDKSMGDVDEQYKAGIVQMRLYIGESDPKTKSEFVSWPSRMRRDDDVHRVLLHIFQCRDLPAADDNGMSDPYLKINNFGGKDDFKTATIQDSVNPIYYETIDTLLQYNDLRLAPPLVVDIFDYDTLSDDFIGRAIAYYHQFEIEETAERAGKPRWVKITPGMDNAQPMGELLVGVNILDPETEYDILHLNRIMRPETTKMQVEINILGLRGLKSTGILPIKKPFIKFNLNSLVPPNQGGGLQNILTQPSAKGKDANINSVIKFQVKLPKDPLYCPKIACSVYDYIFLGLAQPLLGTFNIPIGQLMQDQIQAASQALGEMDYVIEKAQEKLDKLRVTPREELQRDDDDDDQEQPEEEAESAGDIGSIAEEEERSKLIGKRMTERSDSIVPKPRSSEVALLGQDSSRMKEDDKQEESPFGIPEQEQDGDHRKKPKLGPPRRTMLAGFIKKGAFDIKQYKKEKKFLGRFIIYPEYTFDEKLKFLKQVNQPPKDLFFGLGYDPSRDAKVRHYRRFYDTELEEVDDCLGPTPFNVFGIKRGMSRNIAKQDFSSTDPQALKIPEVGRFKGLIKVSSESLRFILGHEKKNKLNNIIDILDEMYRLRYGRHCEIDFDDMEHVDNIKQVKKLLFDVGLTDLHLIKHLNSTDYYSRMSKALLVPTKCIVRVYIVEAFGLPSKDAGGDSDPYLIVKLGKKKINDRDNYMEDTPHPVWCKHFDFDAEMPGASTLNIQVWDHDTLFSDEFIGETNIDVEDRFFSPRWKSLVNKPLELRSLFTPTSTLQMGQIRLWVEILDIATLGPEKLIPLNISERPGRQFQIRLCIFGTKDVKTFDIEGTSDVYIKAFLDPNEAEETDVHYRCQNGRASFNWRILFDTKFPLKRHHLTLQIWDKDFLSGNDYIADSVINFSQLGEDVFKSGKGLSLNRRYYDNYMKRPGEKGLRWESKEKFWVPCRSKDPATGEMKEQGEILVQFDIIEKERAQKAPVGKGRTEPNNSPYLPPPVGRISFSLNPFKMINQLVGPELRRKFYCICCCLCCCIICISLVPLMFSDIASGLVLKLF